VGLGRFFVAAVLFNHVFILLFLLRDLIWGQESLLPVLADSDAGVVADYLKILSRRVAIGLPLGLAGSRSIVCA
jgi:hypothetical protein